MCGGLRLALVYLEKVLQLQGHAPGRNLTNFWKKSVRVAERSLKSLASGPELLQNTGCGDHPFCNRD